MHWKKILTPLVQLSSMIVSVIRPPFFIRGEKSNYINADDGKSIAQNDSNAKVVTIAEAGQWGHAGKPNEGLDVEVEFLRG
nr:hypothetical protein [Bacteroidota bacterium]